LTAATPAAVLTQDTNTSSKKATSRAELPCAAHTSPEMVVVFF
jgi:hypothetical protein